MKEIKTRLRMIWAILRGRSVVYKTAFDGIDGVQPLTNGAMLVEIHVRGCKNAGVTIRRKDAA